MFIEAHRTDNPDACVGEPIVNGGYIHTATDCILEHIEQTISLSNSEYEVNRT
jgi:hypothetical protein